MTELNLRQRGAQPENRNNLRHGLKAGKLPADATYIENRINKFRRSVEDAVLMERGDVGVSDAALIQTALRWERHASLSHRWLSEQWTSLSPLDRMKFSKEIALASSNRDKALEGLKLQAVINVNESY